MDHAIPLFSAERVNAGLDLNAPTQRVITSHWYVLGNEVSSFEQEFAAYCCTSACVSLANGTDALELGLRALDVGADDPVMLAANAGFYGSTAVHAIGATPVYIDVDPETLTMSAGALREELRKVRPKAIIVTHLYGQLADIESIAAIAGEAKIPVVEDCAQSHGAARGGRRAGSFGTIGCFSFYPTKNLGALGDGGAVVTNSAELDTRLRQLRQYGWRTKYHVDVSGGRNSRLDEMQAAILREKLPHLDRWNAERRRIARRYNEAFSDLPLRCPASVGDDYVAHLYVLRISGRDAFRAFLREHGVTTDVHYPVPDHHQAAYASPAGSCLPVTEAACGEVVSLPCFPGMTDKEVEHVSHAVRLYFGEQNA